MNTNKQRLIQCTQWLCAFIQWLYWLMTAIFVIAFLVSIFSFSTIEPFVNSYHLLFINGLDVQGSITPGTVRIAAFSGIVTFSLMAMVFRNAMLIIKTGRGKTWFSKGDTPFQSNIVRMIREMGIFLISVPVIQLIASILIQLVSRQSEVSVDFAMIPIGLLLIVLSVYFQDGVRLQHDVDGLI